MKRTENCPFSRNTYRSNATMSLMNKIKELENKFEEMFREFLDGENIQIFFRAVFFGILFLAFILLLWAASLFS
jgi:hypothetical protein